MAEDWKTQLASEDPRVRAEAVKTLAHSGDRANLPYLKEIVENDPDPRVRDYAKKAARHLFTSTESAASESPPPPQPRQPEPTPAPPPREPEPDPLPSTPEPETAPVQNRITKADRAAAENKIQRALSMHMRGDTQKALKSYIQGLDLDPNLANETFTRSVAAELTGLQPDHALAILQDPEQRKELIAPQKKKTDQEGEKTPQVKPRKSRKGIMETWTSFFVMTEDFLAGEAGHANTEDTLISILVFTIAAVLSFMITGFFQFQQIMNILNTQMAMMEEGMPPLEFNFGIIFFFLLIGTLIMTPLSFFLGSGLQYLGARIFGGSGEFKSHLYLLAVIQVPVTVLGAVLSILGLVPLVNIIAGLAGFGLSIFTLIITVRAIKAVHNLSTGRAIAGMIAPPLVLAVLGGCLMTIFGSALLSMLAGMPAG